MSKDNLNLPTINAEDLNIKTRGLYYCKINSEQAKEWLKYNTNNRKIRNRRVCDLICKIKAGEWRDDLTDPILFSNECLLNGQHRLTAIAEAELTNGDSIWVRVETGADPSVREAIDEITVRRLDDRVDFVEDKATNQFIATIINTHCAVRGRGGQVSPTKAKEFFNLNKEHIIWIAENHRKERGVGCATVALAAMEYHQRSQGKAERFYKALFQRLSGVQQADLLSAYLLEGGWDTGRKASRVVIFGKAICCMKAHCFDKEVKRLVVADW